MNKKKFNKKKIFGMIKTYHAKQRQVERMITDATLTEVLLKGKLIERGEHDFLISYEGYHVHLSSDLEKIITVIAPQKAVKSPATISSKVGKKIKQKIKLAVEKEKELGEEEMTFDDYMKNRFPRKK
jgi:hypothetical protein